MASAGPGIAAEIERAEIGLDIGDLVRIGRLQVVAGLGKHIFRAVERDHAAAREALQQLGGEASAAAAGVDHRFIAAQLQPGQHLRAPRLLGPGDAVIDLGVPLFAWLQCFVVGFRHRSRSFRMSIVTRIGAV